ncbi:hypothetical protein PGT21_034606 [Puccinia graminis f. sp. tritici]|uniref:RING-type E3 ubiquitin transferase n=1 Tax=Puccinia graminis f. sp. tritici TaxID=56615 RepID=A0A5B0RKQ2_PUCGR|nr:hypothetical protein PGT21_034606 [Puccinia graminis f. sp. tritici]KAA1125668.1 hypothetical protein PGTUg99_019058 [Puccinia graminis f. sp. tritici]
MENNSRRTQPSSLPFLILIGLLFYFFSNSTNSNNQSQSKRQLERRLEQRNNELIGLKQYYNTNNTNNTSTLPITPQLSYHPNRTFGSQSLTNAQQFIQQWYQQLSDRSNIESQAIYWKNISGHIKGHWRWRKESLEWWPESANKSSPATNSSASSPLDSFETRRGNFPWTPPKNTLNQSITNKWTYPSAQKIDFNLRESSPELIRANTSMVRGSMYISSGDSKDIMLEIEGIHLQNEGKFYLRAYPSRMYLDTRIHLSSAIDIPNKYLVDHPHLNQSSPNPYPPSPQQLQITQAIIADYEHRIEKIKKILKKGDLPRENDERDGFEHDVANCTFLIYGGLTPLSTTTTQTAESLMEYERSLVEPTGASLTVPSPGHPILQTLMVSPNCGLVLESGEMSVLLGPSFWSKTRNYGWVAGLVLGLQCWLLVWQMDSRQSPSSLSRMSYFSLVAQIIMDAWTFSSHLTLAVVTNNSSTETLLVPAFFACLNAILFGMRYGALIRIHEPSPTVDPANRSQAPVEDSHIGRDTDYVQVPTTDLVDPPNVEPSPAPALPPRQSRFRSLLNALKSLLAHRPLVLISIVAIFLLIVPFLLYSWQPLVLSILFSYWIPQIVHNVQHGTSRRGLRKRYVLGTTLCRLFLPLYIWGCPNNVLFVTANPWIWMIALYSLSQAMILILQDYLGARFFLLGFCFSYEPMWDYHPVKLPTKVDLEQGGSVSNGEKMPECVICFEPIDVLPSSPTSSTVSSLDHQQSLHNHHHRQSSHDSSESPLLRHIPSTTFASSAFPFSSSSSDVHHSLFSRWSYMVPPCHHIAHTKCLEGWLAIKSECPVCRRPLPPI